MPATSTHIHPTMFQHIYRPIIEELFRKVSRTLPDAVEAVRTIPIAQGGKGGAALSGADVQHWAIRTFLGRQQEAALKHTDPDSSIRAKDIPYDALNGYMPVLQFMETGGWQHLPFHRYAFFTFQGKDGEKQEKAEAIAIELLPHIAKEAGVDANMWGKGFLSQQRLSTRAPAFASQVEAHTGHAPGPFTREQREWLQEVKKGKQLDKTQAASLAETGFALLTRPTWPAIPEPLRLSLQASADKGNEADEFLLTALRDGPFNHIAIFSGSTEALYEVLKQRGIPLTPLAGGYPLQQFGVKTPHPEKDSTFLELIHPYILVDDKGHYVDFQGKPSAVPCRFNKFNVKNIPVVSTATRR